VISQSVSFESFGGDDDEEAKRLGIIRVRTAQNVELSSFSRTGSETSVASASSSERKGDWWNGIGNALNGLGAEVQKKMGLTPKVCRGLNPKP
jgi:hypothetical protein